MSKYISLVTLIGAGLFLSACVQERFEWGSYEPALYAYYKSPDQRAAYEKALVQAIESGRKTNRMAPGMLAELGYLRLEDGKTAEAKQLFEEEIKLFPESRTFLTGVINRMAPTADSSVGSQS